MSKVFCHANAICYANFHLNRTQVSHMNAGEDNRLLFSRTTVAVHSVTGKYDGRHDVV